jgi:hypothetical protein
MLNASNKKQRGNEENKPGKGSEFFAATTMGSMGMLEHEKMTCSSTYFH